MKPIGEYRVGTYRLIDIIVVVAIVAFLGSLLWKDLQPATTIVQTTQDVRTVYIDKPVLTEKLVEKFVSDPKDKAIIASLMAENKKLSVRVTALTQTVADVQSHGGGIIVTEPAVAATPDAPAQPAQIHFKDWRLDFRAVGETASYDLAQKFEILTTSGRDKDGKPISLVKLFELGEHGERVPAVKLTTTAVVADETSPHWILSPAIQAGLVAGKSERGGIVGLQWLKRGRTKAAEDSTLAFMTPVIFISQSVKEPGVLPISVNLGQIKYQPFKDLWVSPYVGIDVIGQKPSRVGAAITATF